MFFSFYQRVLKLAFDNGFAGWTLVTELDYKFEDGPECICGLETFCCTEYCSMGSRAVVGILGIEWDLFFGKGRYVKRFNDSRDCYTDHVHEPIDCPPKPKQMTV